MDYKEDAFTASEITQLEYILSIMPDNREVERIGLEYRLKKARQKLEGVPVPPRPKLEGVPVPPRPKTVNVAFQGDPVVDGVGINAEFSGRARRRLQTRLLSQSQEPPDS